ncbi:MAG: ubiquitin-like domain-containing protein [Dehalococcoidales bacterium]|nr:ubiquitin-like domain-containing protein [Dehalococcoidales bacterium]
MTRSTVTIVVDGHETTVRSNARTVISALRDAHVEVDPSDSVSPGRYAPVEDGLVVLIERATPLQVRVDGAELGLRTRAATVEEALADAGVQLGGDDIVIAMGQTVHPETLLSDVGSTVRVASAQPLSAVRPTPATRGGRPDEVDRQPLEIVVKRAVPLTVHDNGLPVTINTTADTVGEALEQSGINVYLADAVRPSVQTPVQANLHVYIERSKPVTIVSDDPEIAPGGSFVTRTRRATFAELLADEGIKLNGRETITPSLDSPITHDGHLTVRRFRPVRIEVDDRALDTKTKQPTVRQLLADEQISLGPLDRVEPGLDTQPEDDMVVQVTRVNEVVEEEQESLPFETLEDVPNPEIELDDTGYQAGEPGVLKRSVKVTYENGQPVDRTVLNEWVDKEPVPEVYYYGTKVVIREVETPEGTVKYWRKLTVLATYYHNSTTGKDPSDPEYGITRTGTTTRLGVVATDPNVIPLWTRMYVPGYGIAVAEDTGGGVKGKHIDLYYPEGISSWGVRYPTIYLLTPVPDWYPERLP